MEVICDLVIGDVIPQRCTHQRDDGVQHVMPAIDHDQRRQRDHNGTYSSFSDTPPPHPRMQRKTMDDQVKVTVRQDFLGPPRLRKAACSPNLSHKALDILNQAVLRSSGKESRLGEQLATMLDVMWTKVKPPPEPFGDSCLFIFACRAGIRNHSLSSLRTTLQPMKKFLKLVTSRRTCVLSLSKRGSFRVLSQRVQHVELALAVPDPRLMKANANLPG